MRAHSNKCVVLYILSKKSGHTRIHFNADLIVPERLYCLNRYTCCAVCMSIPSEIPSKDSWSMQAQNCPPFFQADISIIIFPYRYSRRRSKVDSSNSIKVRPGNSPISRPGRETAQSGRRFDQGEEKSRTMLPYERSRCCPVNGRSLVLIICSNLLKLAAIHPARYIQDTKDLITRIAALAMTSLYQNVEEVRCLWCGDSLTD
jgi:hypothetical protein